MKPGATGAASPWREVGRARISERFPASPLAVGAIPDSRDDRECEDVDDNSGVVSFALLFRRGIKVSACATAKVPRDYN